MNYLLATSLVLLNTVWLLLVIVGLPGNWLMVGGTLLVAWWRWDTVGAAGGPMFGIPVLVSICALAVVGEILEFFAGVVGSKTAGGSRRGAAGALLGALGGAVVGTFAIPVPVLGSLLGTCAGAALGAWGFELHAGRAMRASLKSGVGAGIGRLTGTVLKAIVGVMIWIVVAVAAFWP